MDDDRAVEDPGAVHQRGADHDHRAQVGAGRDDLVDRREHALEQGVLEEQVVDRVAAQRQLGEHRHRDAVLVAGPRLREHRRGVGRRVRDRDRHRAGRDPGEPVRIGRVEVHTSTLFRRPVRSCAPTRAFVAVSGGTSPASAGRRSPPGVRRAGRRGASDSMKCRSSGNGGPASALPESAYRNATASSVPPAATSPVTASAACSRGGSGSACSVKISTTRSKDRLHSSGSASRSATR